MTEQNKAPLTKRKLIELLESLPVPDSCLVIACVIDASYVTDVLSVGNNDMVMLG